MTDSTPHAGIPKDQAELDAALFEVLHSKKPDFSRLIPLMDAGADPNARDEDGVPAFHSMVEWGNIPAIRHAISLGADVRSEDEYRDTPLHKSITPEVALELLLAGASPLARNDEACTPRAQLLHTGGSADYSNIISATRLLLRDAEVIAEDASKHRLSTQTLDRIWPDKAFEYGGSSADLPHENILPYLLKKAVETNADIGKDTLLGIGKSGDALGYLVPRNASNIRAWVDFCEEKGSPMTVKDWRASEVLENIEPDAAAALFDAKRIEKAPDLQGMYELFAELPANLQDKASGTALGKAISQSITAWLNKGVGNQLKSSEIRAFRNEMPEKIRPLFTNFHQEEQSRRHMGTTLGR